MSRRVRRDSETSTDSWSLVEEDHLDDDFSLNSTDNEESIETEPIIEEPLTTDDEEEDTASEKSLDSESEDSDDSEDSESSDSEGSDLSEQEEEEVEEEVAKKSEISGEDSEDSDDESVELSDEEDQVSDEEEEDVEDSGDLDLEIENNIYEIGEGDEITARSEVEAALKCKEDMEWMYEEVGDLSDSPARKIIRVLFAFSLFLILFPIAEIFTSWMLNVKLHRTPQAEYSTLVFDSYSPPSYDAVKRSFVYKEESDVGLRQWRRQQKASRNTLHLLEKILNPKSEEIQKETKPLKSFEILELFKNQTYNWKHQSEPRIEEIKKVDQKVDQMMHHHNQSIYGEFKKLNFNSKFGPKWNSNSRQKRHSQCKALAPVPPAPFSPRKVQKLQYPRHQPCFVHVNQSKWTCQKNLNLPSVVYHQNLSVPNFTVLPRKYSTLQKQKQKAWGSTGTKRSPKYDICGKKASQSMRTISKPTDTCHSRQLSKIAPKTVSKVAPARKPTPPRKHIAYKAPLPCLQSYAILRTPPAPDNWRPQTMPEMPKMDDWVTKRSRHRAQYRNRA